MKGTIEQEHTSSPNKKGQNEEVKLTWRQFSFTPATGNTHISKDSWVWVCRMASCPFLPWSLQAYSKTSWVFRKADQLFHSNLIDWSDWSGPTVSLASHSWLPNWRKARCHQAFVEAALKSGNEEDLSRVVFTVNGFFYPTVYLGTRYFDPYLCSRVCGKAFTRFLKAPGWPCASGEH